MIACPMTDAAQQLFDLAEARLPVALRPLAERHWRAFRDHLPRLLPAYDMRGQAAADSAWLAALPRVFACSDFVARTCAQHPDVLHALVAGGELTRACAPGELARRVAHEVGDAPDEHALKARLRALRRRELLRIAIRDLAGLAPLPEVLAELSEFADASIEQAVARLEHWARERHGVPTGEASGKPVGFVVLALGKLGGRELNFSSDVDLMFAYGEEGETAGPRPLSNHEFFVRLGQQLIGVLAETTADGFVFRVDLRLRPNGASGPLAISFDAMEEYYQSHGREWERYALIKARAVGGDRAAGQELLARLRPFVFRRYLDYGAFEALRAMKHLIEREVARKGMQDNLKLGPGGIREIEFIVQAQQLIRGGREPALQEPHLLAVLPRLAARGYVTDDAKQALAAAYGFLRRAEHRLQMVADAQTQMLPQDEVERERLALACGHDGWATFGHELERHRAAVQKQFAELLSGEEATGETGEALAGVWLATADADAAEQVLRAAGYDDPAAVLSLLKGLHEGPGYGLLSADGRARLDRLMPRLLAAAARAPEPGTALARLVNVIEAIGRRTTYFSLLIESPAALAQFVKLAGASPWIAAWIARHPIVLDELIDSRSLYELPTREELADELRQRLAHIPEEDLELQMEILREFRHGHLLRVAAADIGTGLPAENVGRYLADIAEVVIAEALAAATRDLIARHGRPAGRDCEFAVIAYGKLGSRELGYGSDLDMIFLYDAPADAMTDGTRAMPVEQFYARLGQRLIHILTTRTPGGILYEVDMRLRPSGKSGPLVTSVAAFRDYQHHHAWTWEHQALVRARAIAGNGALCRAFEEERRRILCKPRDPAKLRDDVLAMRGRMLETHRGGDGEFDLKHDRGGIVDIEFMVQYAVLRWVAGHPELARHTDNIHLLELLSAGDLFGPATSGRLAGAYRRYLSLEHHLKLMERGSRLSRAELGDLPEQVREIWKELFD
jgi:glutamate-ammonia-ligase adenylyltransferase